MACVLCSAAIPAESHGGHGAFPLSRGQCCDACNWTAVIPARLASREVKGRVDEGASVMCATLSQWRVADRSGKIVFFSPARDEFRASLVVSEAGAAALRAGQKIRVEGAFGTVQSSFADAVAVASPEAGGVSFRLDSASSPSFWAEVTVKDEALN